MGKLKNEQEQGVKLTKAQGATLVLIIFAALLLLVTTGCAQTNSVKKVEPKQPPISSKPLEQEEMIKLYFSDDQAMYLKPEVRQVTVKGETLADVVVQELIKGPENENLLATIPAETKLISLKIADNVAYVNLSKELQCKHSGGSTGEIMTVYSIVNTLIDLNIGIEQVQLLVEGEKQETLVGHLDTFEPLLPEWGLTTLGETWLGPVVLNDVKLREIQASVNEGELLWQLDPVQVARERGSRYGFDPRQDEFVLAHQDDGSASVQVERDEWRYQIELTQPVDQGQGGIWAINAIQRQR